MTSPIPQVYKSIIRFTAEMIDELNLLGLVTEAIGYHNWESRGEESELPRINLIGTDGFSFDENNGRWIIRYGLAISSYHDADLIEEIELIGAIDERMGRGKKIPLVELTAGEEVSELVVTDFRVLPMAQSEIRNYRTIGVELQRTGV